MFRKFMVIERAGLKLYLIVDTINMNFKITTLRAFIITEVALVRFGLIC